MNEQKFYKGGIEEKNKSYIFFENIFFISLVSLGFLCISPFSFSAAILYAFFAVVMLVFILRKHLCTTCYYYGKWCHCGWGRLSSAMFEKDSGDSRIGGKLAALTWGIIMGAPVIAMVGLWASRGLSTKEWSFFVIFLVLTTINLFLHKRDCGRCKMRYICSLSGAKNKIS